MGLLDTLKDIGKAAKEAVEGTGEKAGDVRDAAEDVNDALDGPIGDALDDIGLGGIADAIGDAADKVEDVAGGIEDAAGGTGDLIDNVDDLIERGGGDIGEQVFPEGLGSAPDLGGVIDVIAPACASEERVIVQEAYIPRDYDPPNARLMDFVHGLPRVTGCNDFDLEDSCYLRGLYMGAAINLAVILLSFGVLIGLVACRRKQRKARGELDLPPGASFTNEAVGVCAVMEAPDPVTAGSPHIGKFSYFDVTLWVLGAISIVASCLVILGLIQLHRDLDEVTWGIEELSRILEDVKTQLQTVIGQVEDAVVMATELTLAGTVACIPLAGEGLAAAALGAAVDAAGDQKEKWQAAALEGLQPVEDKADGVAQALVDSEQWRVVVMAILSVFMLVSTCAVVVLVTTALVKYRKWMAGEISVDASAPVSAGARRTRVVVNGLIAISVALAAVVTVIGLSSAMLVSDFCVDPDQSTKTLLGQADGGLLDFYQTCNPTLAFPQLTNQVGCYVEEVSATATNLAGVDLCSGSGEEEQEELEQVMTSARETKDVVLDLASCESINPLYQALSYDSFCEKTVQGSAWIYLGGIVILLSWAGMIVLYYSFMHVALKVPGLKIWGKNQTAPPPAPVKALVPPNTPENVSSKPVSYPVITIRLLRSCHLLVNISLPCQLPSQS
ncbi:unnamed protein product [Chrysoparadoxa australica]